MRLKCLLFVFHAPSRDKIDLLGKESWRLGAFAWWLFKDLNCDLAFLTATGARYDNLTFNWLLCCDPPHHEHRTLFRFNLLDWRVVQVFCFTSCVCADPRKVCHGFSHCLGWRTLAITECEQWNPPSIRGCSSTSVHRFVRRPFCPGETLTLPVDVDL